MGHQETSFVSAKKQSSKNKRAPYNNAISSQCNRILEAFKTEGPQSTFRLRSKGIMHPGGRVRDLRDSGYKISTHRVIESDENDVPHSIALYVLHGRDGGNHV